MDVLFVGKTGGTHVGGSFQRAASDLGLHTTVCDVDRAFDAPWLMTAVNWHLLGHRPPRLRRFSEHVVDACRRHQPTYLLTTGLAPVDAEALRAIGDLEVRRLNFLTDDPWNPVHRASWFFEALPRYDVVFTPRRANEEQLRDLGLTVEYVPFGYDNALFYPEPICEAERERLGAEMVFVGGADDDRVPLIRALRDAGIEVAVYGNYWDDYPGVADSTRGLASPETIRKATRAADVALCLVRRANRDGHVMRSFEIPATGACMLAERTDEHRALFGPHGEHVHYFASPDEMVDEAQWLLDHPKERRLLARSVHEHVKHGEHTYRHRLETMLHSASVS